MTSTSSIKRALGDFYPGYEQIMDECCPQRFLAQYGSNEGGCCELCRDRLTAFRAEWVGKASKYCTEEELERAAQLIAIDTDTDVEVILGTSTGPCAFVVLSKL